MTQQQAECNNALLKVFKKVFLENTFVRKCIFNTFIEEISVTWRIVEMTDLNLTPGVLAKIPCTLLKTTS